MVQTPSQVGRSFKSCREPLEATGQSSTSASATTTFGKHLSTGQTRIPTCISVRCVALPCLAHGRARCWCRCCFRRESRRACSQESGHAVRLIQTGLKARVDQPIRHLRDRCLRTQPGYSGKAHFGPCGACIRRIGRIGAYRLLKAHFRENWIVCWQKLIETA